jgi:hypothetical protein
MSLTKLGLALAAGAMTLGISGCGENKVTVYKQGQYQGKPDSRPWENDRFKGNQVEWEKSLNARNQAQNEYTRITAGASQ